MPRDYVKNTSNYMGAAAGALGGLLNGAAAISVHAWIRADTFTTGAINNNRVLNFALNNTESVAILAASDTASGAIRVQFGARVATGETFAQATGTTTLSTGTWYAIGGVANFAGDVARVYLNGTQEGTAAPTWTATSLTMGSPTTSADRIGATAFTIATATQFDGLIGHVAGWNVELAARDFVALAAGVSPLAVQPLSLKFYYPLWALHSPEIELVNNKIQTITGTLAAGTIDAPVLPYLHHLWVPSGWTAPAAAAGHPAMRRLGHARPAAGISQWPGLRIS